MTTFDCHTPPDCAIRLILYGWLLRDCLFELSSHPIPSNLLAFDESVTFYSVLGTSIDFM